ncbi:MAG TPA: hypothetical protein VIJ28_04820 [Chloroflexota bacterium]|jgi:hypothetical protein
MHARPLEPLEAGDDARMEQLLVRAVRAMAQAGVTAGDFLEALPEVRAEVRRELYDEEYLREIERRVAAYREAAVAQSPRGE